MTHVLSVLTRLLSCNNRVNFGFTLYLLGLKILRYLSTRYFPAWKFTLENYTSHVIFYNRWNWFDIWSEDNPYVKLLLMDIYHLSYSHDDRLW